MLGLLEADAGTVRIAGRDPLASPVELRRHVGYLAEDQAMYGWMTPVELYRFLKPFYPTWDDALADKLLDGFELARHARIGTLSKGQTVKLGLAVALAHQPDVTIFDDPALGLDPIARKQFNRDLVEHLQSAGRTVIYSSHLLDEVEAVADTVAILDRGVIVRQSATEAIRHEVQQVSFSADAVRAMFQPAKLLDVREHEGRVIAIVDGASAFVEHLRSASIPCEVELLSLDEIFEAFVIGRVKDWPKPMGQAVAGVA
jgi:ABC-2 type transport system ATP-binding protein